MALAGAGLLTACADTGYYLQSLGGQLQMMQSARPVKLAHFEVVPD